VNVVIQYQFIWELNISIPIYELREMNHYKFLELSIHTFHIFKEFQWKILKTLPHNKIKTLYSLVYLLYRLDF